MGIKNLNMCYIHWCNDLRQSFVCCMVIVFFCCPKQSFAQNIWTTTQILAGSSVVVGGELIQNNLQFLKETKQGMPLVDKMEIRTETDEFDLYRQEYLFRMSFNGKKTRNVQSEITKNNIHFYDLKAQLMQEAHLIDQYERIVDWYYTQAELNFLKEEKIIQEDKKKIHQKMLANSLVIEVEDLLKVEKELQALDRKILQQQFKKEYILQELIPDLTFSEEIALDTSGWISFETMTFLLGEIKEQPIKNLGQDIQIAKINFEQLEFELEKAENKQVLDFVQIKYAGRDNLELQRDLSIGIGLNIPTKSGGRIKLNETKLNLFDQQYKLEILQKKLEKKISINYKKFDSFQKEYALLSQQITENELINTLKDYSSTGVVHPLTLLRIASSILKDKQALQKIEKEACLLFLAILVDKGLLTQSPNINYLSNTLIPF